jgi:hypothetical protein
MRGSFGDQPRDDENVRSSLVMWSAGGVSKGSPLAIY